VVEVGLIVRIVRRGPYAHHDDPEPDAGDVARLAAQ
jgi:hypothetical protein